MAICNYIRQLVRAMPSTAGTFHSITTRAVADIKASHGCKVLLPSLSGLIRALKLAPFWGDRMSEALITVLLELSEESTIKAMEQVISRFRQEGTPLEKASNSVFLYQADQFLRHLTADVMLITRNILIHVGEGDHRSWDQHWKVNALTAPEHVLTEGRFLRSTVATAMKRCSQVLLGGLDMLRHANEKPGSLGPEHVKQHQLVAKLALVCH